MLVGDGWCRIEQELETPFEDLRRRSGRLQEDHLLVLGDL